MQKFNFVKMHGLGNDFAIFDLRGDKRKLTPALIRKIACRNTGIGFDQLIAIKESEDTDCELLIYNQDGSSAGACGNATRCVAMLLGGKKKRIKIGSRILETSYTSPSKISVNMGLILEAPKLHKFKGIEGYSIDIGNPHLVFFVEDYNFDVADVGQHFENHKKFPDRINVNFAKVLSDKTIELKVWERGAGLTKACGSGACATQFVANCFDLTKPKATVKQAGGNLEIEIKNGEIIMTGPATKVFDGVIEI